VTIAQAIHESYWGSSNLAKNANNFFGIKARNGEGSAGVYMMDAWEVINGQDVVIPEPFRKYNSPDESFLDHGQFFLRNSRYHGAFKYSDDPRAFAQAIADAGYATDPAYAPKLIRIMDQYDLYQYDLR
jgi:flagellum-specific peptidoglycan hydrolase FlgJ